MRQMKPSRDEYDSFMQLRDNLIRFLNTQGDQLPKDWGVYDHALVVLQVAIQGLYDGGASTDLIREEMEVFLRVLGDRKTPKTGKNLN